MAGNLNKLRDIFKPLSPEATRQRGIYAVESTNEEPFEITFYSSLCQFWRIVTPKERLNFLMALGCACVLTLCENTPTKVSYPIEKKSFFFVFLCIPVALFAWRRLSMLWCHNNLLPCRTIGVGHIIDNLEGTHNKASHVIQTNIFIRKQRNERI